MLRNTVLELLRTKNKKEVAAEDLCHTRRNRKYGVGKARMNITFATAQVVRHNRRRQMWFEQQ